MSMFRKAERRKAKLRLGLSGPSGAGKTYSSLLIASGIAPWDKIAVIDSENGSADLYAHLGDYSVLTLTPPYSPEKYISAIHAAEQEGFEVIIIDSLTHAWAGEGGILDQQGKATDAKYKGNSFGAWREFTPKHNALVEAMLKSKSHIIATLRSKTEYVLVEEFRNGKTQQVPKKIGMAPIQRDGMEYEFTVFMDISPEHTATASKDRTGIVDGQYIKPDAEMGKMFFNWLEQGADTPEPQQQEIDDPSEYQVNFKNFNGKLKDLPKEKIQWIALEYKGNDKGLKDAAERYLVRLAGLDEIAATTTDEPSTEEPGTEQ